MNARSFELLLQCDYEAFQSESVHSEEEKHLQTIPAPSDRKTEFSGIRL